MSQQISPAEQLRRDIASLQRSISTLEDKVRLRSVRDSVEDIQSTINGFDRQIADLRKRGYAFGKNLEAQATDFESQWAGLVPAINREIETQAQQLQSTMRNVDRKFSQLNAQTGNISAARSLSSSLESDLETLESKASSAERSVNGMFDTLRAQVHRLKTSLQQVDWMLAELAEASFQLMVSEAGIMAVKAVWVKDGKGKKDDPEGVLYLTDQRLIFEQKEEVATKKILFITTEKEMTQNVLLDVPVVLVESVETSKRGLLKNEDFIQVNLESGAQVREALFHIWQPCDEWQALIQRARAREFDAERAVPIDPDVVEKVRSAPSQCPSCGGNIDVVIMRGQNEIKCEYCGLVIRL
ncbi:MAG: hypothetical protein Kow002_10480 [Anaerolineales bacterium]